MMQPIMVHMANREWTLAAMHTACALARNTGAEVTVVKMVAVHHPGWLGTDLGYRSLSWQDHDNLRYYQATAEDYGVAFSMLVFQYVTLPEALVDAAAYIDAQEVFAVLPQSLIPYWRQLQLWNLRRQLSQQGRCLYTLEAAELSDVTPTIEQTVYHTDGKQPA
jgi:hypothetical protein